MDDPSAFVGQDSIERHRRERADRGFSDYDWWNFNTYLSWVIIAALTKFKEEGSGYPSSVGSPEAWYAIIDEMIEGFEAQIELDFPQSDDRAAKKIKADNALALFAKYYSSLWD